MPGAAFFPSEGLIAQIPWVKDGFDRPHFNVHPIMTLQVGGDRARLTTCGGEQCMGTWDDSPVSIVVCLRLIEDGIYAGQCVNCGAVYWVG